MIIRLNLKVQETKQILLDLADQWFQPKWRHTNWRQHMAIHICAICSFLAQHSIPAGMLWHSSYSPSSDLLWEPWLFFSLQLDH